MAYTLTGLTGYTQEETAPIIKEMILGAKTLELIDGANRLLYGIKGATKLPVMNAEPTIQADSCNLSATGGVTLTQMSIDVAKMAIFETLCEKELEQTVFRTVMKVGSNYDTLVLRDEIVQDKIKRLKLQLEKCIWQGDTTLTGDAVLKWFDGYIKLFKADGNVIDVTPSPKIPLATSGNARVGLKAVYAQIPLEIINEPDVWVFAGLDVVRNYQMDLAAANLYNPAMFGDAAEVGVLPLENSHIKVIGLAGLTGTKIAVCTTLSNLYAATDLANEEEKLEIEQDPIKKSLFYIQAAWKLGVSYAYGDKVAIYEWS